MAHWEGGALSGSCNEFGEWIIVLQAKEEEAREGYVACPLIIFLV